jgi:ABC-type nitrate/sulfonate/bicarbonate transport system substrate-binding protein
LADGRVFILLDPMPFRPRFKAPLVAALGAALALSACGGGWTNAAGTVRDATIVLDFTPNAIHAGIYSAISRSYAQQEGVHLHVVAPPASPDSIKLLETGRANFAILDIHDLAIARQDHQNIVGIMAIVERPLAAVIAAGTVKNPRQLQGKTVGVPGDPSDYAVLRSIVSGAGGSPRRVKTITIGFNAVPALLAHRVTAATAFWNDEGVTLAHVHRGFHSFLVQEYGAPSYPELVLCATATSLRRDPSLARAVVRAIVRGYEFTLKNPEGSEADLESAVQNLDPRLVAEQLTAERTAFRGPGGRVGVLDHATLTRWAKWEQSFGIVKKAPDIATMFDSRFLPSN